MFRITTAMFTEHTGLQNAYEMIEYAIDGFSCRRDLIAKHFLEVWNGAIECKSMCDRCVHKDSVQIPKINIVSYCMDLYKIIDRATSLDIKLTALKLLDTWYQKGKKGNLRIDSIEPPKYERYYGEQMIAFLILKGFLKEDFHFSAYSTISYIRKGDKVATEEDRIVFYGARVLHLPESSSSLWGETEEEECSFVSEHKKRKRRKSKKHSESQCSLDGSEISAGSSARKRHKNDSDASRGHETPTTSKTRKHKREPILNTSYSNGVIEITDDGYQVISCDNDNVIKIEDD